MVRRPSFLGWSIIFPSYPLNASARAKQLLANTDLIMGEEEKRGVNVVLNAAALTYVAALFTAVLQLLYWASLVSGVGGRRR